MAWIESHQALGRHPKLIRLASLLRVSRPTAVGHLHYLWWWALDYAPEGTLSEYDDATVADASEWNGRDPTRFVQALSTAGWLDTDRALHDWDDYAGRLLRARAINAERMRAARAPHVQRTNDARADHVGHTSGATVPNPTEPNRTVPDPTQPKEGRWPEEAVQLASKYIGNLRSSSPKIFKELTPELALEIAADEGLPPLAAARMLGDVRDWWDRAPPSKRWKFATRGWRNWCRREAKRVAEEEPEPSQNGNAPQIPHVEAEPTDWDWIAKSIGFDPREMEQPHEPQMPTAIP